MQSILLQASQPIPRSDHGQSVVDRRGDPSVVLDLVVEFFALVTHFQSAFAQVVGLTIDKREVAD
jgi:hypothetical protein